MPDENQLSQEEIERLLGQAGKKGAEASGASSQPPPSGVSPSAAPSPSGATSPPSLGGESPGEAVLDQKEIKALISGGSIGKSAPSVTSPAAESPDAEKVLSQEEIERLLSQTGRTPSPSKAPPQRETKPEIQPVEQEIAPADVEYLLHQAEQALASLDTPNENVPPGVAAFRLEEFSGAPPSTEAATLDLIRDVELDLRIELGRTHMYLEDVLRLRRGSVVPLDKLAGDPVDIYVNDRLIARGEVLVLNDNFCVRVAELLAGMEPEKK